jgi:hypothetical protein
MKDFALVLLWVIFACLDLDSDSYLSTIRILISNHC